VNEAQKKAIDMFVAKGYKPTIVVCINDILAADRRCGSHCRLEDMARGCWPIGNSSRARKCEWLMAVDGGRVVGVWKILRWWKAEPSTKFKAYLKLRPPKFDGPNCFHGVARRYLRYICDVSLIPQNELGKAGVTLSLPSGFRLYGQIGYINA